MISILIFICDTITTFFQSFLITSTCNNIAAKDNKLQKLKLWLFNIIICFMIFFFSHSHICGVYENFVIFLCIFICCIIFYRKSIMDAILGFGIVYSILVISSYIFISLNYYLFSRIDIVKDIKMFLFVFIPVWIMYSLFYFYKDRILNLVHFIKNYASSLVFFIIISYSLILLNSFRVLLETLYFNSIGGAVFYFLIFLISIFAVIYFANVSIKSKEVEKLNNALNEKISELRKIKHDYGSEISCLYGLYKLDKYDKVGEMLKSIVNRHEAVETSVYVNNKVNPIVDSVLTTYKNHNIDFIVFDNALYENLSINDHDLFKVVSNIIRNSVDALCNVTNPIIKFKSYNICNGVRISICNNGPEIPKDIREKIFEAGFSTKNNNGDRGFGLAIVDDIINKCSGKITLKSNEEITQFNIEIPFKSIK